MLKLLLIINLVAQCLGATTTTTCGGGTAYEGSEFTASCTISGTLTDGILWLRADATEVVTCDTAGSCTSNTAGYTATQDVLTIASPSAANDAGDVTCQDGLNDFTPCTLVVSPAMTTSLLQDDVQSLTSQTLSSTPSLTLNVVATCTSPVGTCTWNYQNVDTPSDTGTIDSPVTSTTSPTTSNSQSCTGSNVFTQCTLSLTSTPSYLANKKVTISLTIAHPSLSSSITTTSASVLTFSASSSSGHLYACAITVITSCLVGVFLHVL